MANDTPARPRGPQPIRLLLSDHEEFLAELRERGPNVEPIVRVTVRRTPDASGAQFLRLTLLATYLRRIDEAGPAPVLAVVRLAAYVGAIWPGLPDAESRETHARVEELRATLERAVGELGYRAGAGVDEPGGAAGTG
jgi:hypothetical protein